MSDWQKSARGRFNVLLEKRLEPHPSQMLKQLEKDVKTPCAFFSPIIPRHK